MNVKLYGCLADRAVSNELAKAQQNPEQWTVYLVKMDGRQRTPAQNRLFHTVVRKLAQQLGRDVQYWQDYLIEKFLGFEEVTTEDGYTRRVLASTSSLTVVEFTEFLNACLTFAADNQVH